MTAITRRAALVGLLALLPRRAVSDDSQLLGEARSRTGVGNLFPIRASSSGAYLVDATGNPWLMVGDSAQNLMGNLPHADAQLYLSTRGSQGFNAIQFDCVSTLYINNNNANYATPDGITPFSPATSYVTSPNPTYFARVDQYVNLCAQFGMVAILNPYETGGGINDLVNAGTTACNAYGRWLGNRYNNFPNVMWQLGNDCDCSSQTVLNVIQALAQGLLATAPNQLVTMQWWTTGNSVSSTAFDSSNYGRNRGTYGTLRNLLQMNGIYTYAPTYFESMVGYNTAAHAFGGVAGTNASPQKPSILLEANYEFENINGDGGGTPLGLRRQGYWIQLAGQSGQIYGNGFIWGCETSPGSNISLAGYNSGGWKNNMATLGTAHLIIWKNFFNALPWYNLVPDQAHTVGTAGYGRPKRTGSFGSDNYVPVAATADGGTAVAYFSRGSSQTLTV